MENALIIGASGGIGRALVAQWGARYAVTGLSRSVDGLDVTDEASVAEHLGRLEGPFSRIVVATGALEIEGAEPEKTIKALDPDVMAAQFRLNAIGPALVLKHALPLIARNAPCVVAVLSARVGSIGDNDIGGWISYRSAKAAVNQVVRTTAIELARTHKQACLIALHPGTVATNFTHKYLGRHPSVAPAQAAANIAQVMAAREANDTGQFYDWAGKSIPW
jgi:NAD(P)-dependent dehydrogenase (short-subunit alcohol dehydrogenase family)